MGAKTALLAYSDGGAAGALRSAPAATVDDTAALLTRLYPGWTAEPIGDCALYEGVYPPDGIAFAGAFPGVDVVCDRQLASLNPSSMPEHLLSAGRYRRMVLHAMHSGSDSFAFAVWDRGQLVRSLSLGPDGGVAVDVGEPFDFEAPYWAGEHPAESTLTREPYPLPFHPLELGEAALRELCGFILEGTPSPDDVDAGAVRLHGFRLRDPAAPDPAIERAKMQQLIKRMRRRSFTYGPDGSLVEIDLEDSEQP